MHLTRAVLGIAGVPLVSGCMMMGGWGHTAGPASAHKKDHTVSGQTPASPVRSEASNGGLTIMLSLPRPTMDSVATITASLRSDRGDQEPIDGEIWLRVQTPSGSVDQLRMQKEHSLAGGIYQAQYGFPTLGLYAMTADARAGAGTDLRTVSVMIEVEIGDNRPEDGHHWLTPAALGGGLGMLALMAVMMGGSWH